MKPFILMSNLQSEWCKCFF